eukprot:1585474-Amphidinium_carterae.1
MQYLPLYAQKWPTTFGDSRSIFVLILPSSSACMDTTALPRVEASIASAAVQSITGVVEKPAMLGFDEAAPSRR